MLLSLLALHMLLDVRVLLGLLSLLDLSILDVLALPALLFPMFPEPFPVVPKLPREVALWRARNSIIMIHHFINVGPHGGCLILNYAGRCRPPWSTQNRCGRLITNCVRTRAALWINASANLG